MVLGKCDHIEVNILIPLVYPSALQKDLHYMCFCLHWFRWALVVGDEVKRYTLENYEWEKKINSSLFPFKSVFKCVHFVRKLVMPIDMDATAEVILWYKCWLHEYWL